MKKVLARLSRTLKLFPHLAPRRTTAHLASKNPLRSARGLNGPPQSLKRGRALGKNSPVAEARQKLRQRATAHQRLAKRSPSHLNSAANRAAYRLSSSRQLSNPALSLASRTLETNLSAPSRSSRTETARSASSNSQ